MDVETALTQPPFHKLSSDVKEYLATVLSEPGAVSSSADISELLEEQLVDGEVAADSAEARRLCEVFAGHLGIAISAGGAAAPSIRSAPLNILAATSSKQSPKSSPDPSPRLGAEQAQGEKKAKKTKGGAAAAAAADAAAQGAAVPGAQLKLKREDSDATVTKVSAVLRAERPELDEADDSGAGVGCDFLAASFVAYAADREPESLQQWQALLGEVLADTGKALDDDEPEAAAKRVCLQLARRGLLVVKERVLEAGEQVLAVLPEDDEWHPAVIESVAEGGELHIIFLEYGRPLTVASAAVRALEDVPDEGEGELTDGDCELCARYLKLTFHHLIPQHTHSKYIGKRLPPGIEGEPTRIFLNGYGTMICRHCHNAVHQAETNAVLATTYNTVAKLAAHSVLQRWIEYAKKQAVSNKYKV